MKHSDARQKLLVAASSWSTPNAGEAVLRIPRSVRSEKCRSIHRNGMYTVVVTCKVRILQQQGVSVGSAWAACSVQGELLRPVVACIYRARRGAHKNHGDIGSSDGEGSTR